jgi:hypothetical protein
MATKIGDLIVELKANTAAFSADMGKAMASLNSATAQMRAGLGTVSNAFTLATRAAGVFGLSLGVAALVNFGRRSLDAAGGLGEMAEQLGITTDSLQTYQFAAAQSGVSTEEMQAAIQRFTRTIGDARDGSDTAVKSVRALGGEFERLVASGASIDALLLAFADRIAATGDKSVASARGADLMGRGFQRMLPILQSGAAGVQAFSDQLENMGLRLDAETIRKADAASDAIARMSFQVNALAQTLVSRLAPAIESAARGWNAILSGPSLSEQIVKENKRLLDLRRELAEFEASPPRFGAAAGLADIKRDIDAQEQRVAALIAQAREQAGRTPTPPPAEAPAGQGGPAASGGLTAGRDRQLIQSLEIQRDSIDKVGAALLRVKLEREVDEKGQRVYSDATIEAAIAIQEQTDALNRASEAGKTFAQIAADNAKSMEDDRLKARERSDAILQMRSQIEVSIEREQADTQALTAALEKSQRAYEEEAEFIRIRNQYRAAGIPLYGDEIEAARRLAARNVEANRALERTGAASQELANFTDRAFDRVGNAITEAMTQGEDAMIDFKSVARGVLSEITQEFIKLAAINPMKNALFGQNNPTGSSVWGSLLSGLGSAFGSGSANGFSAGTSSLPNFGASTVTPGFALGTENAPRGLAWVGEQGPELVRFRGGERVFSAADSAEMASRRRGPTIVIDARGSDREGFEGLKRMVRQINGSIETRAAGASADMRLRGIVPA